MATLKDKNVLVTGGAGFIGSHLCDNLLEEPIKKLIAVDNLFLGKESNLEKAKKYNNFYFKNIDVTEYDSISEVIDSYDIDIIFHLAVIPLPVSLEKPIWSFDQNIKMSTNLCDIIRKKSKIITLIHFSSSEAYGSAIYTPMDENHPLLSHTPYAASKAATDLLVYSYYKTFGIDMAIIRPFNNYGPRQNEGSYAGVIPITVKRLLNGDKPIIFSDGKQTRDFIYVGDTAYWTVEVYKNEGTRSKVINLASGQQITIEKVIKSICDEMNYKGEIEYRKKRPGDVLVHEGDVSLAREILNFKIKVNFEDGIKDTVKWYINNL